jgi:hypothetical protein
MELATFDISRLPTFIMTLNPVEPTAALMDKNFIEVDKILNQIKDKKGFQIVNLLNAKYLNSDLRIKQGNWLKEKDSLIKEKLEGVVIVNNSMIMTIVVKGILLIKKPPVPMYFVKTVEEALALADEKQSVLA